MISGCLCVTYVGWLCDVPGFLPLDDGLFGILWCCVMRSGFVVILLWLSDLLVRCGLWVCCFV